MNNILKKATLAAAALALGVTSALAGEIVINYDGSDPAPKKAFEMVIKKFEAAHPGITVKWNLFDHEGYKTSIRNFLTADAPDIAAWYAGNRMAPFVKAGLFEPVDDVWADNGLNDALASTAPSMTIDGKKWGVPYTYYQWGIYYRKDLFAANDIAVPKNWKDFLAACAKLKSAGITPITIGTKYLWTAAGVFDYLNLRTNGYQVHNDLTSGKIKYTDPRIQTVFDRWEELVRPGYFIDNHAALSWQEALAPMVQGKAAMYVMGNFAVAPLREAGLSDDQLDFMQFPQITAGIPMAEEAPTDTFHIPTKAKNKADARKFLAFLAAADTQTEVNKILGQLPTNKNAQVADDKFIKAGFEMLSNAAGLAQFYDRDAPAAMAKAGMEGFQEFMIKPDRRDAILKRLDKVQAKVYK
ncbi:MAG: extracellular solute-binding protein [Hyphomicrobiales bacterium]|nr:extracellular solute-binding protein [Hyphomicrobiales bacterium]